MKTILCYGDSNTWGYDPVTGHRFGSDERWPGVLRKELGGGYHVIEEGLRHCAFTLNDPVLSCRKSSEYLSRCLGRHSPLDLVAIMAGCDDLSAQFNLSSQDIADGVRRLVETVQKSTSGHRCAAPQVLLIAPPLRKIKEYAELFAVAVAKARLLPDLYARIAQECSCHLLDSSKLVVCSDIDGIHLGSREHSKLGRAVATFVQRILESELRHKESGR